MDIKFFCFKPDSKPETSNRNKLFKVLFIIIICALSIFSNQYNIFAENLNKPTNEPTHYNEPVSMLLDSLIPEFSVSIASKAPEKMSKAPSIVTVITAEEIENMGARTLKHVLRTIPGFDIIQLGNVGIDTVGVRGFKDAIQKIRIMIDGHSINIELNSDAIIMLDEFPIRHVKRIEIIRGPGSALYGTSAFLAVINIITKKGEDIDGLEVAGGFGTYDTQDYSISYGKKFNDFDVSGFVNFYNTNGLNATVKEDGFSELGPPFTITPGRTDASKTDFETYFNLSYKDLHLKGKYMDKKQEPLIGAAFILTDDGELNFNHVTADLSYDLKIGDKLKFTPSVYYDQYDLDQTNEWLPNGFPNLPDGAQGTIFATYKTIGTEIQTNYDFNENHKFTIGFNQEWRRMNNSNVIINFDLETGAPFESEESIENFDPKFTRRIWAIYVQHKWNITDEMGLTLGVRHDHYSDVEGTTNPRFGFVWDFMKNATLKLLYGQAFRAPSFGEISDNPNTSVEPEKIRTYEASLAYKFPHNIKTSVNYFFNVIRDEIEFLPPTEAGDLAQFGNSGGSNVQGIEFECKSNFGKGNYAFANYTYQDAEARGDPLPDVPKHKGNVGVNFGITKYLNANVSSFISGDRTRTTEDGRDDSPGYALVNLTLIAKNFYKGFELKGSLFNLLDKNYDDPSTVNTLPSDVPRPGRTFFLGMDYKF